MDTLVLFNVLLVVSALLNFTYLKYKIKFFIISPIYYFLLFLLFSLFWSNIYCFLEGIKKVNLYNFESKINNNDIYIIDTYFIFSINIFLITVNLLYSFSTNITKNLLKLKISNYYVQRKNKKKKVYLYFLTTFLFIINIFLLLYLYKDGYFFRNEYIPEFSTFYKFIKIVWSIESIFLFFSLGLLFKYNPIISIILVILSIFIDLTTASRKEIIFLLEYMMVSILNYRFKYKFNLVLFILGFSIFIVLFSLYLIQLRSLPYHGLIPYISHIKESFVYIMDIAYFLFYYIFIYGFIVTILTFGQNNINWDSTLISLNPLPGYMAGWYNINEYMRLNKFVPYNFYGEIFSMDIAFTFVMFVFLAVYFYYMEIQIRKFFFLYNKKIVPFLLFILILLFIIYSWEYNLRSSIRIIYYSLFILSAEKIFNIFKLLITKR